MHEVGDLQLDRPPGPFEPFRRRALWRVPALVGLLMLIGYLIWSVVAPASKPSRDVGVQTEQQVVSPPPRPVAEQPADIQLPPLDQTDPLVRELVGQLSSHPQVAAWLATDHLVRNFTVSVVNIANGTSPVKHLQRLQPRSAFTATGGGPAYISPQAYSRYDGHADAVAALDARGTARLYATLKPRIEEASRDLGSQEPFDEIMRRAITELLKTPEVDGPVAVRQEPVAWKYADPELQSLSSAQRQLLRMGPRNVRLVKAKLREIAPLIGIAPEKLR